MSRLLSAVGLLAGSFTLFIAADASAAERSVRCGLVERLPGLADRPAPPPPVARGAEGKLTRDAFGDAYQIRTSDNFALKWTGAAVSEDTAALILEALEASWSLYIDVLGHRPPTGGDAFLVNAYVSGPQDSPPIDFGGGYAWIDDDGYPFLVLSQELLFAQDPTTLRHVAAHEFYHNIQLSILAYFHDDAFWYYEATAEWAAQELYPDDLRPYGFVGGYALIPELPLYHVGDPFADPVAGVHQYGASVFPRYLSQYFEDPRLIAASWEVAGETDDPLRVLDDLIGAELLADRFADFATRNAFWDYPQREILLAVVTAYANAFPQQTTVVAEVGPEGTAGWLEPPAARLPRSFGYNLIAIRPPHDGTLVVGVDPDAAGSGGTPARLAPTVARNLGGRFEYLPIDLDGSGEISFDLTAEDELVYLAVAAPADVRSGETFGYRFRVDVKDPVGEAELEEPLVEAGCGCTSSGNGPSSLALALLVLFVWRSSVPLASMKAS